MMLSEVLHFRQSERPMISRPFCGRQVKDKVLEGRILSPSFGRVSVSASHIGAPGFREIRVLLVLVAAVGTDISKVGHDARMEARQTELNVAERIVAGDITELSISGRRVFECPLIVVFRIHDVFCAARCGIDHRRRIQNAWSDGCRGSEP